MKPLTTVRMSRITLNLFWRTFFLLAILLLGSILVWLQTLRELELEPRAIQTAQQVASLVNMSRTALVHSDAVARVSLIKTMAEQEGVRILPRAPEDRFEQFNNNALIDRITQELSRRLGPGTIVARSVNGEQGLWIGFDIDGDQNWLLIDRTKLNPPSGATWVVWLSTAALLSLAGAAAIARLINLPLKQLSYATNRVREGDFAACYLDEQALTSEIREVNVGFNRMAQKLEEIEQDRAVMLAGISHDLRTPLARLRLETEMSVHDSDARMHMASDIEQLDVIIDKFLDYARPDHVNMSPVKLKEIVDTCMYAVQEYQDFYVSCDIQPTDLQVLADTVELGRVISNLLENARRYGQTPGTHTVHVDISARASDDDQWVVMAVRDYGRGVAPHTLPDLIKPFFRGDASRSAATGAGLGLSIVDKAIQRMGGVFTLDNANSGGLVAYIQLQRGNP